MRACRLSNVLGETHADVVALPGTCCKSDVATKECCEQFHCQRYQVFDWGFRPGTYVNQTCGVALAVHDRNCVCRCAARDHVCCVSPGSSSILQCRSWLWLYGVRASANLSIITNTSQLICFLQLIARSLQFCQRSNFIKLCRPTTWILILEFG